MDEDTGDEGSGGSLSTVISGGMLVFVSKVFALGFGYLTQIVMARLLTQSAYGDVILTIAVINVTVLLATLGLNDGLMREFPNHEDDPKKARGVVRTGLLVGAVSGSIVAIVVFVLAPIFAKQVFDDPSLAELIRIGAIGIPFIVLGKNAVALGQGGRDAKPRAIVEQLFQPILRLVFIAWLVVAGFEAAGAMAGQIVAMSVAGLLVTVFALRLLPSPLGESTSMYRPILAFSLPLIAVQGMNFLNSSLDIYMIGYFLNSSQVGVYNIALQLSNLTTVVLITVAYLLPPIITRLDKRDKREELLATYQGLTKWMMMLAVPVFIILFFGPKIVIGLFFGAKYTGGADVLQIVIAGKLVAILAGLNFKALIALGDNRVVSYMMLIQLVLNFAVNYLSDSGVRYRRCRGCTNSVVSRR
ncbi:flippase (plasmid) [Haloarcula sp. NS06]|uniref:flippase n=1 Tax=Haloarcula sp. NS06 TaxID=3409688 RepID=UPI003DA6EA3E